MTDFTDDDKHILARQQWCWECPRCHTLNTVTRGTPGEVMRLFCNTVGCIPDDFTSCYSVALEPYHGDDS